MKACRGLHPMSCRELCKTGRVYRKDSFLCSLLSSPSTTTMYKTFAADSLISARTTKVGSDHQNRKKKKSKLTQCKSRETREGEGQDGEREREREKWESEAMQELEEQCKRKREERRRNLEIGGIEFDVWVVLWCYVEDEAKKGLRSAIFQRPGSRRFTLSHHYSTPALHASLTATSTSLSPALTPLSLSLSLSFAIQWRIWASLAATISIASPRDL